MLVIYNEIRNPVHWVKIRSVAEQYKKNFKMAKRWKNQTRDRNPWLDFEEEFQCCRNFEEESALF
jgi:hypothetical protein